MSENEEEKAGEQAEPAAEPGGETLPAKRQGVTLGQLVTYLAPDLGAGLTGYLREQAEQIRLALYEPLIPSASKVARAYEEMLSASAMRQDWLANIAPQLESVDLLAGARGALESAWLKEALKTEHSMAQIARAAERLESAQERAASFDNVGELLKRLSSAGDISDSLNTFTRQRFADLANPLAGAALAERTAFDWLVRGERRQPEPRRPALPPPPAPVIETPKESEPAWQVLLQRELEAGRATPAQMLAWLKRQAPRRRPGVQGPSWAEIELICLDYERNGHKYANQEAFARRHNISRATLSRYLEKWRLGEDTM